MAVLNINSQMIPLETLLDHLDQGELGVPDFQRPFVWSDQQVVSLLGTVLNGWPSGSLLLMRGDTNIFRIREPEGTPPLTKAQFVILDGQQRLTALYWALRDAGPTVYALQIEEVEGELSDPLAIEERVRAFDRSEWEDEFWDVASQASAGLLPISVLKTPTDFFEWRDEAARGLDSPHSDTFSASCTELYRQRLSAVNRYSFPVVTLEGGPSVAAVARIFEKVNRSGTVLSTFDLMVARVYEPGWNLRDHWDVLCEDEPLIPFLMDNDGMPLLEAIALRRERNVRRSAVLDLEPRLVRGQWKPVRSAAVEAARFLVSQLGVRDRQWLPYRVMLIAMTALATDGPLEDVDGLQEWYWSRAFGLGYDVAANTRVVSDYISLRGGSFLGGGHQSTVSKAILLTGTRRSHRAVYSAFLSLLTTMEARDVTGSVFREAGAVADSLPGLAMTGERRFVTSVFPRGMEVGRFEAAPHLRTLGLVFASQSTRRRLRTGGINYLIRVLRDEMEEEDLDANLTSQLLPPSADLLAWGDDWRGLLEERVEALGRLLRQRWQMSLESASSD